MPTHEPRLKATRSSCRDSSSCHVQDIPCNILATNVSVKVPGRGALEPLSRTPRRGGVWNPAECKGQILRAGPSKSIQPDLLTGQMAYLRPRGGSSTRRQAEPRVTPRMAGLRPGIVPNELRIFMHWLPLDARNSATRGISPHGSAEHTG